MHSDPIKFFSENNAPGNWGIVVASDWSKSNHMNASHTFCILHFMCHYHNDNICFFSICCEALI